ncbi:MAG: hypothetical protein HYU86_11925 [Chloroflexi bacterium]|nr:hypothetical protein [Chloroflexota bacterium]
MAITVKDLTQNPGTVPFSRLKYLARREEEEVVEFFNRLFQLTAQAKDSGQWHEVERFLEEWEERLTNFRIPFYYDSSPWSPLGKPLSQCRLALITTGGLHLKDQEPFNVEGDWSFRPIAKDTPKEQFRIAHIRYDTKGVLEDVNCIFPLDRLKELAEEGVIGHVADVHYGFMGYIPKPEGLLQDTVPQVASLLREAGVDAVLIGTT